MEILELGDFSFQNNQLKLGDRAKLDVLKSMDNTAYLEIITKAKGSSREEAFKLVEEQIMNAYGQLKDLNDTELVSKRMNKYADMGVYKE
jgi:acetyl-CoA carboxylase alpha subunit